jgi:hypothetical protein
MRRWAIVLAALAVVVSLAIGSATAGAVPPKTCSKVRVAGKRYLVVVHGVSCRFGRKWVVARLKAGHKVAPGYRCRKPSRGSNVKVQCIGRTRPKNDPSYRYYYGIRQ